MFYFPAENRDKFWYGDRIFWIILHFVLSQIPPPEFSYLLHADFFSPWKLWICTFCGDIYEIIRLVTILALKGCLKPKCACLLDKTKTNLKCHQCCTYGGSEWVLIFFLPLIWCSQQVKYSMRAYWEILLDQKKRKKEEEHQTFMCDILI